MSTPKYNNFRIYHYESGPVMIVGRFTVAGGPIMGAFFGHGFVPTRVGAGDYLLTFTDGFDQLLGGGAAIHGAATKGISAKFGTFTPGVAGACTLQLLCAEDTAVAATWAAVELAVGEYYNFCVILQTEFQP